MTRSDSSSPFPTLDEAVLAGKRVLVRVDLNVPMENGRITDLTRIDRILANIREISEKGAKVIILSHLGRPKNGPEAETSLKSVAVALEHELKHLVFFASDCVGPVAKTAVAALRNGDILLLENTRFHAGEIKNDPAFVEQLAELGDLYVNDAFSTSHRAHASTEGIAHKLPAYCGRTMQRELEMLTGMLAYPERPMAAIVGGAKVSTKLELLGNLMRRVEYLFIGGGMANTFLSASGKNVGKSFCETQLAETARKIMADADAANCQLVSAGRRHRLDAVRSQCADPRRRRRSGRRKRHDPRYRATHDRQGRRRSRAPRAPSSGTARSEPSRRRPSMSALWRLRGSRPN